MSTYISCDIGLKNLGFSVIRAEKEVLTLLYAENFVTVGKSVPEKLAEIADHFKNLVKEYTPDTYLFEDPVMIGATGAKLNQVIGLLSYLAYKYKLQEFAYKPTEIKKAVTGNGSSDKNEIIAAVEAVFPERKFDYKENHCADSCAIFLCHLKKLTSLN